MISEVFVISFFVLDNSIYLDSIIIIYRAEKSTIDGKVVLSTFRLI